MRLFPARRALVLAAFMVSASWSELPAQVRVLERARYQGFDDYAFDPYQTVYVRTAYYDRARAAIVNCTSSPPFWLPETREWSGPGEASAPLRTVAANVPYTTCPHPGAPGTGLGVTASVLFGITRVYRAGNWQSVVTPVPPSPPAQLVNRLSLALDEARQRAVLTLRCLDFGSNPFVATWEFDGQAWVEASRTTPWKTPIGPHPEFLVYHGSHGRVEAVDEDGEIHSWNGSVWTRRVPPVAGFTASGACYDPHRDRLVVIGHFQGGGQVLEYDGQYSATTLFGGFGYPNVIRNAVYDESRRRIVCTAQQTVSSPLQTLAYEPPVGIIAQWSDLTGATTRPPARADAMLATDVSRGAILFGGRDQNNVPNAETWLWDGSVWTNLGLTSAPSPRSAAGMASGGSSVVLFGGMNANNQALGDTWVCDAAGWRTLKTFVGATPARRSHALATQKDVVPPTVYMFGGTDGQVAYDDLRRLDYVPFLGGYWQWTSLASVVRPAARSSHSIVVDEARKKIVLFGGADEWFQPLADTWEWDIPGGGWTRRTPVHSPPARWDHGMAYDKKRARTVVVGGYDGTYLDDLWEWDGTDWTKRTPESGSIAPNENMAIDFDPRTNRIVMFGGNANATPSDRTYEIVEWNGPGALSQVAPLALTVHGAPTVKGAFTTPLDVAFPCTAGMGVLFLGLAPTFTPSYQGAPPYFCSAQELYTPIALNLNAAGNPAHFRLPVPAALEGTLLSVQGLALTTTNCLDVTGARNVLVRSVR